MRAVLKRTLVILGYAVGSIVVLLLLAYVVLLVINRSDEPPSDLVVQLEEEAAAKVALFDEGNAYLFMLGFDAPPEGDPLALGKARYDEQKATPANRLPNVVEYNELLSSEEVLEIARGCYKPFECATWLENTETATKWIETENWVLQRYQTLVRLPHYNEEPPNSWGTLQPAWTHIQQSQRLLLANTALSNDNPETIAQILERDTNFWRHVLTEANSSLTKSIVTGSVRNSFRYGSLMLRELPPEQTLAAIPQAWREPLSVDERSMKRAFAGEWRLFDIANKRTPEEWAEISGKSFGPLKRLGAAMFEPFIQRQATSNRYAQLGQEISTTLDVPVAEMRDAVVEAYRIQIAAQETTLVAYNPMGHIAVNLSVSTPILRDNAASVADLEGIRRMALLAAELRAAGVEPADMEAALGEAELKDPYTNKPFEWDADAGAIIFRGLERTRLGYHAIVY